MSHRLFQCWAWMRCPIFVVWVGERVNRGIWTSSSTYDCHVNADGRRCGGTGPTLVCLHANNCVEIKLWFGPAIPSDTFLVVRRLYKLQIKIAELGSWPEMILRDGCRCIYSQLCRTRHRVDIEGGFCKTLPLWWSIGRVCNNLSMNFIVVLNAYSTMKLVNRWIMQ